MNKNHRVKCLLIGAGLLLLLFSASASAGEEAQKSPGWKGDAAISLGLTRGNTDTTSFSLSVNAKKEWGTSWAIEDSGSFIFTRASGETTAENMGLISRISYKSSERFFFFGEIQAVRDRFKDFSFRFLPQAGVGVVVLKSDRTSLEFSSGLTQVITRYISTGDTVSYTGMAVGNKWNWKISESADLLESISINTDFSDLGRYYVRAEISLSSVLTRLLAVKLSLIDSYEHKPVGSDIKKNDMIFLAGLSLKF
jgi:putative salt-induced outer membrane protein YdiY